VQSVSRAQIFPTILIALDIAAAAVYAIDADPRRTVYWLSAAVLTFVVTF
jgi:hypothetical protein